MLPEGKYLCAGCTEENRQEVLKGLIRKAKAEYGADPAFTVQLVVVSGILQWNYEVQVYVGKQPHGHNGPLSGKVCL